MSREPGEGTRLLAELTGESAEAMAADPRALGRGLLALGGIATSLVRDYVSDDPGVRRAAEERWAELAAKLPDERTRSGSTGLGPADRKRLHGSLTRLVRTLQEIADEAQPRNDRPTSKPG